ncbi:conjugal transfer protein [Frankia sp. AgKG'84/4]|uniref:conjugal transfer protein n=1 Tax=Frankia sp. AgKG'84/4 TaxID=573490 RepID=UPI00200F75EA|nr:conjugal transfer protein [Frankia sp. AgKG'84/4]MCL9793099.1 conjugal transfer protein [Frankia sp. AgKG'84/4]
MSNAVERSADDERLVFRNYAKAHRHGTVIGQLPGGHAIPFGPYSLTQVGVFVGGVITLYITRGVWMRFGAAFDILVLVGVPYGLAMAERFVRPEGRSPLRTVVALVVYALAPRSGRRHGRTRPSLRRQAPRVPRRILVRDLDLPLGPAWSPTEPKRELATAATTLGDLLSPTDPRGGGR